MLKLKQQFILCLIYKMFNNMYVQIFLIFFNNKYDFIHALFHENNVLKHWKIFYEFLSFPYFK